MKNKRTVSIEMLWKLVNYDAKSGLFVWKQRTPDMFIEGKISSLVKAKRFNVRYAGKNAQTDRSNGYKNINIPNCGPIRAHRVAWAMVNGVWPEHDIDHVNGVRADNRICNLRLATRSENLRNKRKFPRNTSGYVGVYFYKQRDNWNARISINNKNINLGYFPTVEKAAKARAEAEHKYWGEYSISRMSGPNVRMA
jgi:hypothetical protein